MMKTDNEKMKIPYVVQHVVVVPEHGRLLGAQEASGKPQKNLRFSYNLLV